MPRARAPTAEPCGRSIEQVRRQTRELTAHRRPRRRRRNASTPCRSPGARQSCSASCSIGSSRRELVELEIARCRHRHRRGGRRHSAGARAELVGHGARHAAGAAAGRERAPRWPPAIGAPRSTSPPATRSANWRAAFNRMTAPAGRTARAPGAGRARGRLARAGAPPGARAEESAVPAADHRREPAARPRPATPTSSTKSFREGTDTLLAELRTPEADHRPLQRFRQDAAAASCSRWISNEIVAARRSSSSTPQLAQARCTSARPSSTPRLAGRCPADPEQMTRALRNLVLNAMDAMPDGGTLTVRTRAVGDRRAPGGFRHRPGPHRRGVRRACSRRTTPPRSTAPAWAWRSCSPWSAITAGRISVESEPGRGTTFRIELPQSA